MRELKDIAKTGIETEEENELALKRVEKLMDAEPFTDEAKELEELVTLIETFEEIHYPINKPSEE